MHTKKLSLSWGCSMFIECSWCKFWSVALTCKHASVPYWAPPGLQGGQTELHLYLFDTKWAFTHLLKNSFIQSLKLTSRKTFHSNVASMHPKRPFLSISLFLSSLFVLHDYKKLNSCFPRVTQPNVRYNPNFVDETCSKALRIFLVETLVTRTQT